MRAGAGSSSIVTMSTDAHGGWDSRSSSSSVRRTRGSRIGAGSCSIRVCVERSVRRKSSRSAAAPRSARSSATDNGSSSRAKTNDNGSSASSGHSSSSRPMKRGVSPSGTNGFGSSPRASRCSATPRRPSRDDNSAAGSAARSPSVAMPQRSNVSYGFARSRWFIAGGSVSNGRRSETGKSGNLEIWKSGNCVANSRAVVCVAAIATLPCAPASFSARRSSFAITGGSPMSAPSPDTSSNTSHSLTTITRGEKSLATPRRGCRSPFAVRRHAYKRASTRSDVVLFSFLPDVS